MGKWEMVRLDDVCKAVSSNIAQKDLENSNGVYPIYGASGFIKNVDFYKHDQKYIAIVKDGAGVGRATLNPAKSSVLGTMQAIVPKPNITAEYLFYAIRRMNLSKYNTGATIPHIYFKDYKKESLPLPPLEVQQQIANTLDRAATLIEKRKEQIEKLDLLVKSQFIEMFGDPVTNPKGWGQVKFNTILSSKASNGFFARRNEYTDTGNVGILGVANIVNRRYSNLGNLPRTNAKENEIRKYLIKYGDLLFCRSSLVAEGIGKASIIPEGVFEDILFECHVIRTPLDLTICVPEYIQELTTSSYFRKQILKKSKTSTMTTISQDAILNTDILLPPLELQREFYLFVQQVESQKSLLQKSLYKLEVNNKSLTQKCFSGELL